MTIKRICINIHQQTKKKEKIHQTCHDRNNQQGLSLNTTQPYLSNPVSTHKIMKIG